MVNYPMPVSCVVVKLLILNPMYLQTLIAFVQDTLGHAHFSVRHRILLAYCDRIIITAGFPSA